jgi:hypothetical protein
MQIPGNGLLHLDLVREFPEAMTPQFPGRLFCPSPQSVEYWQSSLAPSAFVLPSQPPQELRFFRREFLLREDVLLPQIG